MLKKIKKKIHKFLWWKPHLVFLGLVWTLVFIAIAMLIQAAFIWVIGLGIVKAFKIAYTFTFEQAFMVSIVLTILINIFTDRRDD